jgi:hypothetical protein
LSDLEQAVAGVVQNDDRRREVLARVRVPDDQLVDAAGIAGVGRTGHAEQGACDACRRLPAMA